MTNQHRNVQKLDIRPLDTIRSALATGMSRLLIRKRSVKLDVWRGQLCAEETVTTVEPTDDRK